MTLPRSVTCGIATEGRAAHFDQLQKFAEAVKDWDQAIALSPPAGAAWILATGRSIHDSAPGWWSEAVAEVAELTKSRTGIADQWYNFACVYAVASGKSRGQEGRVRRPGDGVSDDGGGGGVERRRPHESGHRPRPAPRAGGLQETAGRVGEEVPADAGSHPTAEGRNKVTPTELLHSRATRG